MKSPQWLIIPLKNPRFKRLLFPAALQLWDHPNDFTRAISIQRHRQGMQLLETCPRFARAVCRVSKLGWDVIFLLKKNGLTKKKKVENEDEIY